LAAFQTLLYRYTGQEDLIVGTPIANRGRLELEGLIGFFVNTLALRSRLSSDISFRDLLHQVRKTALAAYSHDHVPFEKLVEELSPERSVGENPLFQAWFFLDDKDVNDEPILPGITLSPVKVDFFSAKLDLALTMTAISIPAPVSRPQPGLQAVRPTARRFKRETAVGRNIHHRLY
jgi:non-ribosomal peptide synthetase component F